MYMYVFILKKIHGFKYIHLELQIAAFCVK